MNLEGNAILITGTDLLGKANSKDTRAMSLDEFTAETMRLLRLGQDILVRLGEAQACNVSASSSVPAFRS